jgi:hypothetical protein
MTGYPSIELSIDGHWKRTDGHDHAAKNPSGFLSRLLGKRIEFGPRDFG